MLVTHGLALAIAALLFIAAMVRGAAPERLLAGMLLVTAAANTVSGLIWGPQEGQTLELIGLLTHALLFLAILGVALYANRIYPLWLGGAQIAALACEIATFVTVTHPSLYVIMQQAPFYMELVIMAVGLAYHVAKAGSERASWAR